MTNEDAVVELKKTELWKYLFKINRSYANKALFFLEKINPILNTIKNYFPFYTRHDAYH